MTSAKVTALKARLRQAAGLLRSAVWILDGTEIHSGQRLRILFAGSIKEKAHIRSMAFGEDCTETAFGKCYLWHILFLVRFNRVQCDMAIIEGSELHAKVYASAEDFLLPLWMKSHIALPVQSKSKSYKEDIRRIRKTELEYRITTDDESIEDFFQEIYRPTVNASHGESTIEISYPHMKSLFQQKKCVLLQVLMDELAIAGGLVILGHPPRLWAMGIRGNEIEYKRRNGANTAVYYFAAQHMLEQGFKQMHLGMSRSFLDDGILQFKNKFGHRIIGYDKSRLVLRILRKAPGTEQFLIHNPFVHMRDTELIGSVYLSRDTRPTDHELARLRKKYFIPGLSRLNVMQQGASPGEFHSIKEFS